MSAHFTKNSLTVLYKLSSSSLVIN